MDVIFRWEQIAGVPTMMVYKGLMDKAAEKGTILFFHGLLSDKMGSAKELRSLAENGYLVVSVDNWGHGDRKAGDFNTRFHSKNPDFEKNFIDAVERTAYDASIITDRLCETVSHRSRLGITGISMGGFITYKVLSQDNRFKAGCPIAGCPIWEGFPGSPHLKACNIPPAALLAQHGEEDRMVPCSGDRMFNEMLRPLYASFPERLAYVEFKGEGHIMSGNDWYYLWENVLTWFRHFLK